MSLDNNRSPISTLAAGIALGLAVLGMIAAALLWGGK